MFSAHRQHRRSQARRRRGAVLVKFAIMLPVLIGFTGLTIDGGFMLSSKRQVQNAADAAAMAAAMDLLRGQTAETALQTANRYIKVENGLADAVPLVAGTTFNIPPKSGPHQGKNNYIEVLAEAPYQTLFMHVLMGENDQSVGARAVAGFEAVTAGEGVMVLDPDPPNNAGLAVGGQAMLKVDGRVVVNSEHAGVDENGVAVAGLTPSPAASAGQSNSENGIFAKYIDVVGGVDSPELFKPYVAGDPSPLRCRVLPEPDPLRELPVPTAGLGVDPTLRGNASVASGSMSSSIINDPAIGYVDGQNSVANEGDSIANGMHTASAGEVILHPGIYEGISVSGGSIYMVPGIYVIAAQKNAAFSVTGTTASVVGENVMIYSTGHNYNSGDGTPDVNDGEIRPPKSGALEDGANFGTVSLNTSVRLTPIDTEQVTLKAGGYHLLYTGAKAVSTKFDGMLFFQRRRNRTSIQITGSADDGKLSGTLYAKWAAFDISGQGAYQAQFICGSMKLSGQGNITILGAGDKRGRANNVFLVE